MTPETFLHFRETHPECALLVLSDTRSGTVLAADGALAYPQEYLDAMSAMARANLVCTGKHRTWAIFLSPGGTHLFQRVQHLGAAALTCLTTPDADIDDMLEHLAAFARTLDRWEAAA